ncbi:hypothetical protein OBBRIDRAFT_792348 [Obba rivulosa]|uniref:Diacylglycerol O-acyltransferase n=1 Tax=Obba rivulosa TaxID=1052685 RepID=A0A8E2B0D0_9APHY|nr:hypothetical protein OBBRIDRAFT_792348 [Obba rivulosa]
MPVDGYLSMPGEYPCDEGELVAPENVEERLQWSLLELERTGGLTGWAAKYLLSAGDWIERELAERKKTIGGIDNMWLLLTEATDFNPVCASTYSLRGKLSLDMLKNAAMRQAERFPKYKQRLTSVGRRFHGARFEDNPEFNMNNHVHAVTLPEPAGKQELNDLMGKFIAQEWDLRRPLWEMILIENYHDEDGAECAAITRGHHSLADGQGFVLSQLWITSYKSELIELMSSSASKLKSARRGSLRPSQINRSLRPLDPLASNRYTAPVLHVLFAALFWVTYLVSTVVALGWSVYHAIHQGMLFFLTCWRVEMLTGAQQGPRVHEREFASSRTFGMDDVKICQRAFSGAYPGAAKDGKKRAGHVTLNDVVCAIMADVIAKEIDRKPRQTKRWTGVKSWLSRILPSPIGFFIPISVRSPGDFSMRNLSTGSLVYLYPSTDLTSSVTVHTLYTHIHHCRAELSLLKHSLWPLLGFHLIQLSGQVPIFLRPFLSNSTRRLGDSVTKRVRKPLIDMFMQSFPVILTNVPGPAKKSIELEGVEVIKWTALPPQGGKGTVGMGIISYAGGLSIAVAADAVPSARGMCRQICESFEERFEVYLARAKEVLVHED